MLEKQENLIEEEAEEEINDIENEPFQVPDIDTKTENLKKGEIDSEQYLSQVPKKEEIIKVENCSLIKEIKKKSIKMIFLFDTRKKSM